MFMITSQGQEVVDPYIYIGNGGTIVMYYRLYKCALRTGEQERANNYLSKALEACQTCLHVVTKK
jgi:hypothetical protein